MGVREEVEERFPSLVGLLAEPEVAGLFTRAVQESWSSNKFSSELVASNWFRSQSAPQRRWWVMTATDPGEAKRQRASMKASISAQAKQFGTSLSSAQLKWITEVMLQKGQLPESMSTSPELMKSLGKLWDFRDRGRGQVGAMRDEVMNLAGQHFNTTMTQGTRAGRQRLDQQARRIAMGEDTIEGLKHRLALESMRRFPHMKEQLEAGMSPYEVVAPLRQIVADEMGYSSLDAVNVEKNPAWRNLIGIRDPKSKKTRLMSEAETIRMVRRQSAWWNGPNGKAADAGMTSKLLQAFGKRRAV